MYASNYSFIGTSSSSMTSTQHPRDIKIQECVVFLSRSENKDDRSVWIRVAEIYSTSPQNGIWPNLTGSKSSMSSTSKFVFFGPIGQKQRWPSLSLIGWGFSTSPLQSLAERNLTKLDTHEASIQCLLPSFWFFLFFFWGGGWTGHRGKQICTSCQLYGMPYLLIWFPNNLCGSLQGFALFHISEIWDWPPYTLTRDLDFPIFLLIDFKFWHVHFRLCRSVIF